MLVYVPDVKVKAGSYGGKTLMGKVIKLYEENMALVCPDCGSQLWYIIFNADCSKVEKLECGGILPDGNECPAFIPLPTV